MVSMLAGQLDHRNIGSHVTVQLDDGNTTSGALAVVTQYNDTQQTSILLAHDEDEIIVPQTMILDVNLPSAAAYTLHMKNAVEELITYLKGRSGPALRLVG